MMRRISVSDVALKIMTCRHGMRPGESTTQPGSIHVEIAAFRRANGRQLILFLFLLLPFNQL